MEFLAIVFVIAIGGAVVLVNRSQQRQRETGSAAGQLTTRALLVAMIGLGMLIPLGLVEGVISERQSYYQQVIREISGSWGGSQELRGPILVVPFIERRIETKRVTDDAGRTVKTETPSYTRRHAWVLPETVELEADLEPESRRRGIYESLVYTGNVKISGRFERPDLEQLSDSVDHVEWDEAKVVVLLSDLKSLDQARPLLWAAESTNWESGVGYSWINQSGFHAPVDLGGTLEESSADSENPRSYPFEIELTARGSEGFFFAPLGRITSAVVRSAWPDPSFQGPILPVVRDITDAGFEARWEIPQLARDYPQIGLLGEQILDCNQVFVTGVRLFESVSLYSLIQRSAKYGILFVALTFMTFLVFELQFGAKLHFIQYALIGAALALFFLTLLSLAEHLGFTAAYALAAGVAIAIITGYTGAALRRRGAAISIAAMLAGLYGLLFTILHLIDFALLMGTGLLTLVLVLLMIVTRNLGHVGGDGRVSSPPRVPVAEG